MKILVIEDDELKYNSIYSYINNEKRIKGSNIIWKKSWHSGLLCILTEFPDFILLDMSMPRYDPDSGNVNEEFEPFAGQEILSEMKRRGISIPVVVITAFDYIGKDEHSMNSNDLDRILKLDFPQIYLGMIKYKTASIEWKKNIDNYIKEIENGNFNS